MYPHDEIFNNRREGSINTYYNVDESWKHVKEKKPATKGHIVGIFTCSRTCKSLPRPTFYLILSGLGKRKGSHRLDSGLKGSRDSKRHSIAVWRACVYKGNGNWDLWWIQLLLLQAITDAGTVTEPTAWADGTWYAVLLNTTSTFPILLDWGQGSGSVCIHGKASNCLCTSLEVQLMKGH